MPHRSRKTHNILIVIGGAFALLLIFSSLSISIRRADRNSPIQRSDSLPVISEGLVAGTAEEKSTISEISLDVSNWKTYRDPIYHFEIKYPFEWANPVAKKITDPDFDYEYQASFGTLETLAGSNIEGFTVYVFPTGKCVTVGTDNQPKCATTKSKFSVESDPQQKIFEFSSKVYTYTIVPFIPDVSSDPNLVQKTKFELDEAQKTFKLDPTLQLIPQPQKQANISRQAPVQASKAPAVSRIGRSGKLTGAVASGGRLVCPHPNRKPQKSPNQGKHVDEDCCPDPDEWPNIACAYKPSDYKIMLKL